jgi:hypothetical protein
MSRWSCNLSGECEDDKYGIYPTQEACRVACKGVEHKELMYLISSYNPEDAMTAAPSDQRRVIYDFTGVWTPPNASSDDFKHILYGILGEGYPYLLYIAPYMEEWIKSRVLIYEWWAIQLLNGPGVEMFNWKMIGLAIHVDFLVSDDVEAISNDTIRESVVGDLQELAFSTPEFHVFLEQGLTKLWPEILEFYGKN